VQAFGTDEEKRYITDATHKSHAKINGLNYDANDVDLQLWVAATTVCWILFPFLRLDSSLNAPRAYFLTLIS
jgi:uncharacterized protein (DUF2236 family)